MVLASNVLLMWGRGVGLKGERTDEHSWGRWGKNRFGVNK